MEYWDGTTWHTIATWSRGADFQNDNFYEASVIVSEVDFPFPNDMKIRFRCDASGDADDVYIDDIRILAR